MKIEDVKIGRTYTARGMKFKVMAYGDGYYMVRYSHCIPFCVKEKGLLDMFSDPEP